MKTSELIKKLQDSLKEHGDKDVGFYDSYEGSYFDIKSVVPEYPWKSGELFVDDKEAGVAFISLSN